MITETHLNDSKTDGRNGRIVSYTYDRLIVSASYYPLINKKLIG